MFFRDLLRTGRCLTPDWMTSHAKQNPTEAINPQSPFNPKFSSAQGHPARLFIYLATVRNHDHAYPTVSVVDAVDDSPVTNSVAQIARPFPLKAFDVVAATRVGLQSAEAACQLQCQWPICRGVEL